MPITDAATGLLMVVSLPITELRLDNIYHRTVTADRLSLAHTAPRILIIPAQQGLAILTYTLLSRLALLLLVIVVHDALICG
jgi:hypothetical protein